MRNYKKSIEFYLPDKHRVMVYYGNNEGRADYYAGFLNEGDVERYMPYCFMDQESEMYLRMKMLVGAMEIKGSNREKRRIAWIKSRLEVYGSKPWHDFNLIVGDRKLKKSEKTL